MHNETNQNGSLIVKTYALPRNIILRNKWKDILKIELLIKNNKSIYFTLRVSLFNRA